MDGGGDEKSMRYRSYKAYGTYIRGAEFNGHAQILFLYFIFPVLEAGRGVMIFLFPPLMKIIRKNVSRNAKKHLIFLQLHVN